VVWHCRSLIVRSVVPLVRGSIAGDPLPCSVAEVLTSQATVKGVTPSSGLVRRPRSTCDLGVYGTPNGGSGGPGRDCSGTLGGDGSTDRYCGGGVAALGPLLRGRWRHRRAGARRGGTQHGGALRGRTLLFSTRSRQIR
jgi:hypothetical protein